MAETLLRSQQAFGGDGWQPAKGSWSYASASTITVPSGAASLYQKGDRIKWTQTTVKYGVIVGVADTLLTIAVNTDHTVANAAITLNYYSHELNPIGYPTMFNYTPTLTGAAILAGYESAKFSVLGNICYMEFVAASRNLSGSAGEIRISLPITSTSYVAGGNFQPFAGAFTGAANVFPFARHQTTYLQIYKDITAANWAASETGVSVFIRFTYQI